MGERGITNVATRLVGDLKPYFIVMCGVCAGNKDKVFLGDIIVADRVFNMEEGKLVVENDMKGNRKENFSHDLTTYQLKPQLKQRVEAFNQQWFPEFANTRPKSFEYQRRWFCDKLFRSNSFADIEKQDDWNSECPDISSVARKLQTLGVLNKKFELTSKGRKEAEEFQLLYNEEIPLEPSFKVHVGPLATVGKVIEDSNIFNEISTVERKTLGLDMEGAAIGFVTAMEGLDLMLIAKGVQDYAVDKEDSFREYASMASAEYVLAFLKLCLPIRGTKELPLIPDSLPAKERSSMSTTTISKEKGTSNRPSFESTFPEVITLQEIIDSSSPFLESSYFLGSECATVRFESVQFTSINKREMGKKYIHSILEQWVRLNDATLPLILIDHFVLDVRQSLMAISFLCEVPNKKSVSYFDEIQWLDGQELMSSRDVFEHIELLGTSPKLFLIDFSNVNSESFLDDTDEEPYVKLKLYLKKVRNFCLSTAQNGHRVIIGLPRFMLTDLSLEELTKMTSQCFIAAELFSPQYIGRFEYCKSLLPGVEPPKVLRSLLHVNSSSLIHEIVSFLHSLKDVNSYDRVLSCDQLLLLASQLQSRGFFEVAYRLEIYCRTMVSSGSKTERPIISMDGYLKSLIDDDPKIIGLIKGLEKAPQAIRKTSFIGPPGTGKTTVLLQIEYNWSLPPIFEEDDNIGQCFVDNSSPIQPSELPLVLNGRRCPAWLPFYLSFAEEETSNRSEKHLQEYFYTQLSRHLTLRLENSEPHSLESHIWLRKVATISNLKWLLSSPVMFLLDDFDMLPYEQRISLSNNLSELLLHYIEPINPNPEPGMIVALRWWKGPRIELDHQIDICSLNEVQFDQFISAKLNSENKRLISIRKLLDINDRPVYNLIRNPYLLNIVCTLTKNDVNFEGLNLYKLMVAYVDQCFGNCDVEEAKALAIRYLPEVALSSKFRAISIKYADLDSSLTEDLLELACKLDLLKYSTNQQHQFSHNMLRDYFASYKIGTEISRLNREKLSELVCLKTILNDLPEFSKEWTNVFRLLFGYLQDNQEHRIQELIKLLCYKDPQLSATCLLELSSNYACKFASDVVEGLNLPGMSAMSVKESKDSLYDIKKNIANAKSIGYIDPRIHLKDPLDGMVNIDSRNGIDSFKIGRYPITNMEYNKFINAGGYQDIRFWEPFTFAFKLFQKNEEAYSCPQFWRNRHLNKPNYPVVGVSLFEALAYCNWLNTIVDHQYKFGLPTEAQWALVSGIIDLRLFKILRKIRQELVVLREMSIAHTIQPQYGKKETTKQFEFRKLFDDMLIKLSGLLSESDIELKEKIELMQVNIFEQLDQLTAEAEFGLSEVEKFLAPLRDQFLHQEITPVGVFPPISTGCYDIFGNIWEWCDEWFPHITPPSRPSMETESLWIPAVVKGGPVAEYTEDVWIIIGGWFDPFLRFHRVGFRVCCKFTEKI